MVDYKLTVKKKRLVLEDKLYCESNKLFLVVLKLKPSKTIYQYVSTFNSTVSMQEKMRRLRLTPLPTRKRPLAVQMSLTDESPPDEVKQIVQG